MKKFSFAVPILFLSTILNFSTTSLEAAGCNSHKNNRITEECIADSKKCRNDKLNKNQNKVDV